MPRKLSNKNKASSKLGEDKESIIQHTPTAEKAWYYTLREGGVKYRVALPITDEVVAKVEKEVLNIRNHKFWQVSPYGGTRAYTQLTCFPPFEPPLRLAEVYFPDGRIYRSSTRKITK